MNPGATGRAASFSAGADGTLFLDPAPNLITRRGGEVINALGLDAVRLALPPEAPLSRWRGTRTSQVALSLTVRIVDSVDADVDVSFEGDGEAQRLRGPDFEARWSGGSGELDVVPPPGVRHGFGDVVQSATLAVLIARLILRGGVALHAAALESRGEVVVAYGASGAGKSTLSNRFPDAVLTEEYAMLEPTSHGRWYHALYPERRATHRVQGREFLPLRRLCLLSHGAGRSRRTPLRASDAIPSLLQEATAFRGLEAQLLHNVASLVSTVPLAAFAHALSDDDAWALSALFAEDTP